MKKLFTPALAIVSSMMLLTGCVGLHLGGGCKNTVQQPTLGQQLIDLQKARGAITTSEYQTQRAKLLQN